MSHLETERLILRPIEAGDLDNLAEIFSDPDVMHYLPAGEPISRERADVALARWRDRWVTWGSALGVTAAAYAIAYLNGPVMTMTSIRSLADRSGWSTLYAWAEGLHRIVRERGLEAHITFTGERNDMREVYASSNLVLSLSQQPESFGRTVLEALALGVPVVGYDQGGVGEILAEMFPEGRVPAGNLDELTARVEGFLSKTPHVPNGNPFTLQRMLDSTLELYAALTGARGMP